MANRRIVTIPCNKINFYRYYVELLNPIVKLRKRELDVWAQLLLYNNEYRQLKEEIRFKIVFDYETKAKIAKDLKISMDVLNNNLSELRKKKIVVDNKIPVGYQVYMEDNQYNLTFNFKAKDGKGKANNAQNGLPRGSSTDSSEVIEGNEVMEPKQS
jgi:hypothetical protein